MKTVVAIVGAFVVALCVSLVGFYNRVPTSVDVKFPQGTMKFFVSKEMKWTVGLRNLFIVPVLLDNGMKGEVGIEDKDCKAGKGSWYMRNQEDNVLQGTFDLSGTAPNDVASGVICKYGLGKTLPEYKFQPLSNGEVVAPAHESKPDYTHSA